MHRLFRRAGKGKTTASRLLPGERPVPGGLGTKSVLCRRFGLRPIAALGHEGVELGLVLGETQAIEKFAELALLVFQPLQSLAAVFVEGVIAA